jgi:pyruvate/2-oxoglutarate dehydrogenase complex dihydrolipoamide dehydrogenase (E3) component
MPDSTHHTAEVFDALVLGSGEAGKYLSWSLGAEGKRVALIERRYVGGSCPNIACLPSKNIVHSAKVAWYAQRLDEFGMNKPAPGIDMAVVRERKRAMVRGLVDVHEKRFAANHVMFVNGEGRFVGPRTLSVALPEGGTRLLMADIVIVSTGSRAVIPDIPGLRASQPMTHVEELELDTLPGHLLVLGGGYVGLEFAQAMARFGSRVTVINRGERLLSNEDEDVTAALAEVLAKEGIHLQLGSTLESVSGRSGDSVTARIRTATGEQVVEATHILVAAGRQPNTVEIGLEKAGIELSPNGYIEVNDSLQTTAEGVFAVGDCAGSPQFTHIAYDDYRVVQRVMKGENATVSGRQVPYTLFTDPELAHVGLHEHEAKEQGIEYRLLKLPMAAVLRTRTLGETAGFLKALIAADDLILGFTALGVGAGELLAPVQLAMSAGLPYTALRDLIVTHPTMSEGLMYLFSSTPVQ